MGEFTDMAIDRAMNEWLENRDISEIDNDGDMSDYIYSSGKVETRKRKGTREEIEEYLKKSIWNRQKQQEEKQNLQKRREVPMVR